MARPSGPKTRCGGQWTEARFTSFIKSLLRQGTRRWGPIQAVIKKARVRVGWYLCNACKQEVPATRLEGRKRVKNIAVDHIDPVVDVQEGFTNWQDYIDRMYVEEDKLQLLCLDCHKQKCQEENEQRRANKQCD